MIAPQRTGPKLRHPPERLASLVPVAKLFSNHTEIVGNVKHQRIGVTKPPLPGSIGLLQHPPGPRRIVRFPQNHPKLVCGEKNVRIILGKIDFPQLNRTLKHSPSPSEITGVGKALRALPSRSER